MESVNRRDSLIDTIREYERGKPRHTIFLSQRAASCLWKILLDGVFALRSLLQTGP